MSLEGHTQYVDICKWNPVKSILMTASSDQTCFLWDCQGITKYYKRNSSSNAIRHERKSKPLIARSSLKGTSNHDTYSVTCADWSKDGKLLAIGISEMSIIFNLKFGYLFSHQYYLSFEDIFCLLLV